VLPPDPDSATNSYTVRKGRSHLKLFPMVMIVTDVGGKANNTKRMSIRNPDEPSLFKRQIVLMRKPHTSSTSTWHATHGAAPSILAAGQGQSQLNPEIHCSLPFRASGQSDLSIRPLQLEHETEERFRRCPDFVPVISSSRNLFRRRYFRCFDVDKT